MKSVFLVVIFALFGLSLSAQDNVVREEFYANGNLKLQFVQLDDDLVQATYYFESGQVYEKGFYQNEKLFGKWETFNVNSELIAVGFFADNNKTGDWLYYNNGEVFQVVSYSKGQLAKN